jgi:hypothetical protein
MAGFTWDPKISLGSVLSAGTVIFGLTAGWFTIVADVRANATTNTELERRVTALELRVETSLTQINEQIGRIRDDAASARVTQAEILTELRTTVAYLKDAVRTNKHGSDTRP